MTNIDKIIAWMSKAQKRCIITLDPQWQSDGYDRVQADLLWALDSRLIKLDFGPLVDCRIHKQSGRADQYQHKLLQLGIAVRARLMEQMS